MILKFILSYFTTVGCVTCIKSLLQYGAFVDDIDLKAQTPLFVSVVHEHYDCVKILLEDGADPNGFPRNLTSPAEMACIKHNAAILQVNYWKAEHNKQIWIDQFKTWHTI